jgi:hypothetical protein
MSITRIAIVVAVLAVVLLIAIIIFRGCQSDIAEPETLDPDTPLPGTEEAGPPTTVVDAAEPLELKGLTRGRAM